MGGLKRGGPEEAYRLQHVHAVLPSGAVGNKTFQNLFVLTRSEQPKQKCELFCVATCPEYMECRRFGYRQ